MDFQIDQSCKKQDIDDHVGIENRQENDDFEKNRQQYTCFKQDSLIESD